jgi:hypothetical protein
MMRLILALIITLANSSWVLAAQWRRADESVAKEVVNCLIDSWLRNPSYLGARNRYEIVITIKNIEEFRTPREHEVLRSGRRYEGMTFCVKGKQRDHYSKLLRNGGLVLTNGKPVAEDGEVRGMAYGIMDVYRRGNSLAIYVQSGGHFRKPIKGGGECIYDATSGASRLHFKNRSQTLAFAGSAHLWVADVGLPLCWE